MALLIADYSGSLAAIGGPGDRQVTVASAAGFPGPIPPNTARISIEHPDSHAIVRRVVTAVQGDVLRFADPLGAAFPVGSLVELRNDAATVDQLLDERGTRLDPSDEATIEAKIQQRVDDGLDGQIDARIKPFAQAGSAARVPAADLQPVDELDSAGPADIVEGDDLEFWRRSAGERQRASVGAWQVVMTADVEPWAIRGGPAIPASQLVHAPHGQPGSGLNAAAVLAEINQHVEAYARPAGSPGNAPGLLAKLQPSVRLARATATAIHADDTQAIEILVYFAARTGDETAHPAQWRGTSIDDARRILKTITTAQSAKLDGITWTGAGIVALLSALQGSNRLHADAIQGLPTGGGGGGGLDQTAVDARVRSDDNAATTEARGNVELATDAEAAAGAEGAVPTAAQVLARIRAQVDAWAQTGSTAKIPDDAFSTKLEEIIDSFEGGGYIGGARYEVTAPQAARFTIADIDTAGYAPSRQISPRMTNQWVGIKIPTGEKDELDQFRFIVASETVTQYHFKTESADWEFLEDASGDSYYQIQVPDIPLGDYITVQKRDPFTIKPDRILLAAAILARLLPALAGSSAGDVPTRTAAGVSWMHPPGGQIPAGPHLPGTPENPGDPVVGERYETTRGTTVPSDHLVTARAAGAGVVRISLGHGTSRVTDIYAYASDYTGANQADLRGKAFAVASGTPAALPARAVLHARYDERGDHAVEAALSSLPHWYPIDGVSDTDIVAGRAYYVNIQDAESDWLFPPRALDRDVYIYTGDAEGEGWQLDPQFPAAWARQGQPAPGLRTHTAALLDGPGPGFNVVNSGRNWTSNLFAIDPAFSIGSPTDSDADRHSGGFEVSIFAMIANRSASSVGFDQRAANALSQIRMSGLATAGDIRDSDAYVGGGSHGILIDSVPVYNGSATLGTLQLYLARDAAYNVRPYLRYAQASATNLNFDGSTTGRILFFEQDVGAGGLDRDAVDERIAALRPGPVLAVTPAPAAVTMTANTEVAIVTAPAVTAAQAGHLLLIGQLNVDQSTFSDASNNHGGGITLALKRLRSGSTTVVDSFRYGVSFGRAYGGMENEIKYPVAAEAGDVYSLHATGHWALTVDASTESKLVLYRS